MLGMAFGVWGGWRREVNVRRLRYVLLSLVTTVGLLSPTVSGNAVATNPIAAPSFSFAFGSHGSGLGQFDFPTDVEVDSNDRMVVLDFSNGRIQVFNKTGVFIDAFGTFGAGNGQFNQPGGVAVDSADRIIVSDGGNNRIQIFDHNGNFVAKFGSFGSGNGQFFNPMGVATDSKDRIIVVDSGNDRIQVFDKDGNFVNTFGTTGSGPGQFDGPYNVATDSSDRIIVAGGDPAPCDDPRAERRIRLGVQRRRQWLEFRQPQRCRRRRRRSDHRFRHRPRPRCRFRRSGLLLAHCRRRGTWGR